MRRRSVLLAIAVLAAGLLVASLAGAAGGKKNLKADELTGYQENPDVSTAATGSFTATIDDDAQTITYELSYSGIEGGTVSACAYPLRQAGGERGRLGVPVQRRRQARRARRPRARSPASSTRPTSSARPLRASGRASSTSSWPRCAPGTRT